MADEYGVVYPAIKCTQMVQTALDWLVDRYNDGSLNCDDYKQNEVILTDKQKEAFDARERKERLKTDSEHKYMTMKDLAKETGLSYQLICRIGRECEAILHRGTKKILIDTDIFYEYMAKVRRESKNWRKKE